MRWIDMQSGDLRPSTLKRYQLSLRHLDEHFREKLVEGLTGADFHDFAAARMRKGVSGATVRRDLTVASRVMRVAKRAGWITENPVPDEAAEIKERREPIQPIPWRTMARIIRAAPPGFRDAIRFAARTGARQNEVFSLEWQWVDLKAGTATFPLTKSRVPRVVELTPQTVRELKRQRRLERVEPVFLSRDDERYHHPQSQWRDLVARLLPKGQRPRFHDIRHTFAINELRRSGNIYEVAKILGHSTVKTTERYLAWLRANPAQKPAQLPRGGRGKAA